MNMTGYLVLCNVLTRRIELGAEGWSASQKNPNRTSSRHMVLALFLGQ